MMPPRSERLAFWRDEYALQSFNHLQELVAYMLSRTEQESRMRLWLTVSATVLYARPFRQRAEVRLMEDEVPLKYRPTHNNILLHRDKAIAHRDPDAHKKGVWGNELPIVSQGNDLLIPTTSPAMDNDIARTLLEIIEILIPRLKARSSAFISKYLPRPLATGSYILNLEDNPSEWLIKLPLGIGDCPDEGCRKTPLDDAKRKL
jgi:hypothetical protein